MKQFLFDPQAVAHLLADPQVGLPAGLPFVLDEQFAPIEELNDWLRSLRQRGCYSPRTWDGYAKDVVAWARFLQDRRQGLLDPPGQLQDAVADYRELRLQGDPGGHFSVLGPDAWNRAVSALENYYGWAVESGLTESKPFRYKYYRVPRGDRTAGTRSGESATRNLARAKAGSRLATLRSLAPDYADLFVEVGLGGRHPDGAPDPAFRGRLATRNRAAGMLVRSSGLRRQEFSNLLVWEVPAPLRPFSDFAPLQVPATIAKGSRSRTTWASNEALEAIRDYITLERALAAKGSRWAPRAPLHVDDPDTQSGVINGRRTDWAKLTIAQRRRLVAPDGGSALLFIRGNGEPPEENNWRYTFDAAAQRSRQFKPQFPDVTPHMLRHTFAIETLNTLTRGALSRADRLARVTGADPLLMAILRRNDPLLVLRDLLGHLSLKTTEVYLAAQDPATILSDAELELLEADGEFDDLALTS